MAFATLTQTQHRTTLRLTNYGYHFATLPVPVQRGEEPTEAAEAADRALTEHGWKLAQDQWEPDFGGVTGQVWTAEVDLADTETKEN